MTGKTQSIERGHQRMDAVSDQSSTFHPQIPSKVYSQSSRRKVSATLDRVEDQIPIKRAGPAARPAAQADRRAQTLEGLARLPVSL